MKPVLSKYLTCVLVIFGFLVGVALRDFIGRFEQSNTARAPTRPSKSAAARLGFPGSSAAKSQGAPASNHSAAGRLGVPGASVAKSQGRIATTGFYQSAAESFGFLEYPASKWDVKKKIHARQANSSTGRRARRAQFDVYPEFTKGFIRQVLVEVHMRPQTTPVQVNAMFEHMRANGYVIFHKEPNTSGCAGDCIEYAFLKLNLPV